ncbi:MAG: molybdenum cofactor guanylyltransferase [Hyphomonadaceae bacterium]
MGKGCEQMSDAMKSAGLVLAGGRSSRMGRDKADLEVGGQTLLARAVALLETAGATRVYVAGRTDAENGLADRLEYAGPAVAVLDACRVLLADGFTHALVMPVDMPLMNADALKALMDEGNVAAAYATEPLPFFVSLEAASTLETQPVSLRRLLSDLGAAQIAKPPDDLIFVNANTPEEWEQIRQQLETD